MHDLIQLIESTDAAAAVDFAEALPNAEAETLGVRAVRFGTVAAVMASRLDVLGLNRAVGVGVEFPASEPLLDQLITWYRDAGVHRFFVQLCSSARPDGLREWLRQRGLAQYNNWMKLWRASLNVPRVVTDLKIERIGAGRASEFASIVARGFAWPDAARPWLAAVVGRPGWRHYLALDGEQPVAGAALHIHGETGWLGFAATETAHRGRGAQSALIARRIADAAALGCRRIVVETAEDTNDRRAPSFHNLRRMGFDLAYVRPNYLWTAPPGDRPAA